MTKKKKQNKQNKKRGKKPKKNSSRNRAMVQGNRPFSSFGLPKVSFGLRQIYSNSDAAHIFVATGCETLGQIDTTQGFTIQKSILINPSNPEFSPRLAAIALAFERYRIRKLIVKYLTACAATFSGAIGLMIDYDPDDKEVTSFVELNANESSVLGSVTHSMSTSGTWPKKDVWYYNHASNANINNTDVDVEKKWNFPGRLQVVTSDSSSTDAAKLAGFISVSYEIEFLRLRPSPVTLVAMAANPDVQTVTDQNGNANNLNLIYSLIALGMLYASRNSNEVDTTGSGVQNKQAMANLKPNSNYRASYSVAVDEAKTVEKKSSSLKQRDYEVIQSAEEIVAWYNPDYLPTLRVTPDIQSSRDWIERKTSSMSIKIAGERRVFSLEETAPRAAGDYVVYAMCKNISTATINTIASFLVSGGTGASTFSRCLDFATTLGCTYFSRVVCAAGETRVIGDAIVNLNPLEELD
jgi:hypothetical protein